MPFTKAINEFKAVVGSAHLSPLDKLYKLQFISISDQLTRHKDLMNKFGPLTRDEKQPILTYIMIQSGIPDIASQIDLITAFSSVYMQESPDGCLISETYLSLLASLMIIKSLDIDRLAFPNYEMDAEQLEGSRYTSINEVNAQSPGLKDQSFLGLGQIMQSMMHDQEQDRQKYDEETKSMVAQSRG